MYAVRVSLFVLHTLHGFRVSADHADGVCLLVIRAGILYASPIMFSALEWLLLMAPKQVYCCTEYVFNFCNNFSKHSNVILYANIISIIIYKKRERSEGCFREKLLILNY